MWMRDSSSGCWTSEQVLSVPLSHEPAADHLQSIHSERQQDPLSSENHKEAEQQAATEVPGVSVLEDLLRRSLVLVEVEIPHVALMDGVHSKSFAGQLQL